jgi:2-polyprenyl-3-methyl-5-hydroxy-6-metoxy-1,4-benzoquinol methylase
MANPTRDSYAQALFDFAGTQIAEYIRKNIPSTGRILDVGAGWGKYRFLLPEYEMDAVEVFSPYITKNKLQAYYRKVFNDDINELVIPEKYAAIIVGDTLEHLPTDKAPITVQKLIDHCDHLIVATPFMMPQEEVEGNKHEAHEQEDLNEQVMAERYPMLRLYSLSPKRPGEHIKSIYVSDLD